MIKRFLLGFVLTAGFVHTTLAVNGTTFLGMNNKTSDVSGIYVTYDLLIPLNFPLSTNNAENEASVIVPAGSDISLGTVTWYSKEEHLPAYVLCTDDEVTPLQVERQSVYSIYLDGSKGNYTCGRENKAQ